MLDHEVGHKLQVIYASLNKAGVDGSLWHAAHMANDGVKESLPQASRLTDDRPEIRTLGQWRMRADTAGYPDAG